MAAVTQGDIKFKIEFDRANVDGPIFKFTDQTIYEDPSAVKGVIRVEYNGVVLWDNLSNIDTDPDIDGNSAGQVNGALTRANTQPTPLSLPLAYNDTIVNGEYTITYSLREGEESVITNTVTLDYLFELPEGSISSLVDLTLTSPSITVVDNTNYTYNNITPTGIPTLKLYYPADVDLPEVSVEASQLIVTSFYTGSQVGVLEASKAWNYSSLISDTTFTIGNVTVYSNDVVTDRINIPVEANGDICTIFCCMKDFGARLYQAKSSPTKYAQLSAIAGQVAFYFSSITAAYECGKTENVNLWVNEIRSLVDCNEDCDCDGATPILISPINGETVGYSLSVNDGSTDVSNVTEISFQGASVTNDENGQVTVTVDNSPKLTVTGGDTTVNTVDKITFTGAAVTNDGSGDVTVAIENSPTLTVTGGTTTVDTVDKITFTGATVIDDGSGDVTVEIDAGSSITVEDNTGLAIDGSDVMSTIYNTAIGDSVESVAVGGADPTPASEWKTKTIVQALDTILFPTILASISTPKTISLFVSGGGGIVEIGTSVARTLTANFNRGVITDGDGTINTNPLVGASSLYTFSGTGILSTPQEGNSLDIGSQTVISGSNKWAVTVNHSEGTGLYFDNKQVPGVNLDEFRVAGSITDTASDPVITGRYKQFWGAVAAQPTNSTEVRDLPSSNFENTDTFTLVTGTTYNRFVVAIRVTKSITSVIDTGNLNANITGSYVLVNESFTVNDAGGNPVTYKLYEMVAGIPYSTSTNHLITTA
jgi:hypothetical protein